ncbi:RNA-binding protein 44 [Tautogolabrus adspersus]
MASHQQQTLWSRPCSSPWCSCWPLPLPYEVTLFRPQFSANDYAETAFPPQRSPYYYNTVIQSAKENKRFFLDRSLFDLVDTHRYLSLTDQKLLGWYLGLSQEDRKLIQDEGGFNQFLQRHPALELSSHHVYVKSGFQTAFDSPITQEPSELTVTFNEGSSKEHSVDDNEASSSCEDSSDNFHSVMEDDQSILACRPIEEVTAGAGVSETSKPDPNAVKTITAERSTSSLPRLATCDVMVGTEQATCMPAFTQTEEPRTSDKHITTEVHMADLDYLAEEFIKLKTAEEERREQKEKRYSGCSSRKECECVERAQQTELGLLALQYSMCRQHTWRLYCMSVERDQLATLAGNPPADIVNVLQKLESDFNQMRDQILAGVTLAQLKPLSVDCEKLTTGASYIPAQIICDLLGNVPSSSSQKPQKPEPSGEEKRRPESQSRTGGQTEEKEMKTERRKAKRAVTLLLQERNPIHDELKPEEKQAVSCKELNSSEAWYDAEEDLCAAATDWMAEDPTEVTEYITTSELSSEQDKKCVLFVSNLPPNVTEHDVMMQFEKHHASEVSVSALKNGVSVAIVMISGPQCAEAAVRELNGLRMQGHTLHVEHINRATEGLNLASASNSGPESPQTSNTRSKISERQLTAQPPLGSPTKNRKVVCISPTAKGTCVPQHYCTMGSFDTLMAELTQRHPDVGRQRIVDALLELKAKHQGVLSGLPLRTIRDMTSELLTRPASPEQF